jgi:hypothetical protein
MANNVKQFTPDAGTNPAGVRLSGGPQLGKTFALAAAPMSVGPQNGAPSAPPMVQQSVGMGQSPISSPQAPKGAQPVMLLGAASPLQSQQTQMPMAPSPRPAMGQAPSPFLTKTPPQQVQQAQGNFEVHRISIIGLGNDGKKYLVEFDAAFPVPASIEDISEKIV